MNKKQTSKKVAKTAAKLLGTKKTPKQTKSVSGSALAQTKKGK